MDYHWVRFIILAVVIALSVLRAIRRGAAKLPRSASSRPAATPPSARTSRTAAPPTGIDRTPWSTPGRAPGPTPRYTIAPAISPIEPDGGSGSTRLAAALAALVVWLAGNVALWVCLFVLPAFDDVPRSWRFAALVIANVVLTALARVAAARVRGLAARPAAASANPIGE